MGGFITCRVWMRGVYNMTVGGMDEGVYKCGVWMRGFINVGYG